MKKNFAPKNSPALSRKPKVSATRRAAIMRIDKALEELEKNFRKIVDSPHEEPVVDKDLSPDVSEMVFLLSGKPEQMLSVVLETRKRIANDPTYGVCQECEGQISPDRLAGVPEARECIRCRKEFEKENGMQQSERLSYSHLADVPAEDSENDDGGDEDLASILGGRKN